ncbi:MAG TPA: hypothetical protein VM328_02035 [Fimbriimonadaceae bacterium]|nr:hypothetical protein [Fimbriimonadaceae bacterium]
MRAWQFGKPKGPGFGLSRQFYLSVLSSRATLPPILDVLNPAGERGAARGFGAPLAAGKSKQDLLAPIERGAYALASHDRKTVLKLLVLSKEEAGFDPELIARSSLAAGLAQELVNRIRATWTLMQLTFESHDPDVYPSLDFLLALAARLAALTEGVVADPIAQRYLLPDEIFQRPRLDPKVDAREHVVVKTRPSKQNNHAHTLGLMKFALPELEMYEVSDKHLARAEGLLMSLAQNMLLGRVVRAGERLQAFGSVFEAREGGLDRAIWEGIPCLEILPARGSLEDALSASGSD